MKILKTEKSNWFKWLIIILACYLLASYGVNGVVNPMHYFEQGLKEEIAVEYSDEYIIFDLSDKMGEYSYLNIVVENINVFSATLDVTYNYQQPNEMKDTLNLSYLINSYKLDNMGKKVMNVAFQTKDWESYDVVLEKAFVSEDKQVEVWKTIELFFSFVGLVCFYMFMQWISKRYAK